MNHDILAKQIATLYYRRIKVSYYFFGNWNMILKIIKSVMNHLGEFDAYNKRIGDGWGSYSNQKVVITTEFMRLSPSKFYQHLVNWTTDPRKTLPASQLDCIIKERRYRKNYLDQANNYILFVIGRSPLQLQERSPVERDYLLRRIRQFNITSTGCEELN